MHFTYLKAIIFILSVNVNLAAAFNVTPAQSHPTIIFPGGGIFFYWQAGAITYLRDEAGYDFSALPLSGASAGALAATLTATNTDFEAATNLALDFCDEYSIWERPLGLFGVWGGIIEQWLDELLPEDAVQMVDGRLSLLVTPVPSFKKHRVSNFENKQDLIACNMASVHLPWFLDKKPTAKFRDSLVIDGSFLSETPKDYIHQPCETIVLDWQKDPVMAEKSNEIIKLVGRDGIWSIFEQGREFAKNADMKGEYKLLYKTES